MLQLSTNIHVWGENIDKPMTMPFIRDGQSWIYMAGPNNSATTVLGLHKTSNIFISVFLKDGKSSQNIIKRPGWSYRLLQKHFFHSISHHQVILFLHWLYGSAKPKLLENQPVIKQKCFTGLGHSTFQNISKLHHCLWITCHMSQVTYHVSHVTCIVSNVTSCNVSSVTSKVLYVI